MTRLPEAVHIDFCGKYLCKWDGEYEGQCGLPKGHRWPHFDGLTWFDDEGLDAEVPDEAAGYVGEWP